MIRIVADNVGVLLDHRGEFLERMGAYGFPVEIALPCGWTYVIEQPSEVPVTDERCLCGLHWAVVYRRVHLDRIIHELEGLHDGYSPLAQTTTRREAGEAGRTSRPATGRPHGVVAYLRTLWGWLGGQGLRLWEH